MPTNQAHHEQYHDPQAGRLLTETGMKQGYPLLDANRWISRLKHLLCLVFPLTTLMFLVTGVLITKAPLSIPCVMAFTLPFWAVLLVDWLCPTEKTRANDGHSTVFFSGILGLLTVIQLLNVLLMLDYVTLLRWDTAEAIFISLANLIGLRFLVGTSSGTSGIVLAHELIHQPERHWQLAGRLLLCTVCYEHFVITHKRGHHLNLGMPDDIATAKLGESFKDYWRRIYIGYFNYAWRSEEERLASIPNKLGLFHNHVFQGLLVETVMLILIAIHWGWLALAVFLYQAWVAVRILEAVNYFQHWGLENGQFGNTFGWVCPSWISRYALIGLSHHIGHHQDENKRFYEVAFSDQGPMLPYGYFVMNLWVKLGNGSYQKMAVRELEKFRCSLK